MKDKVWWYLNEPKANIIGVIAAYALKSAGDFHLPILTKIIVLSSENGVFPNFTKLAKVFQA